MSKLHLGQYKGPLSAKQAAAGARAASSNAMRLFSDAESLLEDSRYPSAAALAILAIEEAGKVSILRGLALERDGKYLKKAWRDYRSHTKKNVLGGLFDAFVQGARRLGDFSGLFGEDAEHPVSLDQLKQVSFYTDCLGSAHWSIPCDVVSKELATSIVELARPLCRGKELSDEEMELWVQHFVGVWRGEMESMEAALVSWYSAMQDRGLAEPGKNKMETFILRGIAANIGGPSKVEE